MKLFLLCVLLVAAPVAHSGAMPSAGEHDQAYWQAVIANDFTPPQGEAVASLLTELNRYLASPDPALRDGIAYTVLTQWIYVKQHVPPDALRKLIAEWQANLARGSGEQGTDSVLLRSFSALMLSVAVAYDNKIEYMKDGEFDQLLHAALRYLHDERDVRGFEPGKGWLHSVAHTADLLKFLGRSRHLEVQQQAAMLTAIADKLKQVKQPLIHGEDARLARAVLSIVARPDADMSAFKLFLDSLKPTPLPDPPTLAALAVWQNQKHFVTALYAVLATDPRESESLSQATGMVRELLGTMM